MSEISLNVRDAEHALHAHAHASRADYLVAALSADPETIPELQSALARYCPDEAPGFFGRWRAGVDVEPWDAGVCVIDLAARLLVIRSTYSSPGLRGEVSVVGHAGREEPIQYHLVDDWLVIHEVEGWEVLTRQRRTARAAPLDTRPVLYDRVCEFIASACATEPPTDEASIPDRVRAIHARWLTTPHDGLGGRAPRDVLLERREHINWDLQDRCEQWTVQRAAPPVLPRDSAAYRFAGFGTHEIVIYYYLVRELLGDCWERVHGGAFTPSAEAMATEAVRLRTVRDEWLNAPNHEEFSGHTPASVIEHERVRLPEAMSGADAIVDHDCPVCQMMADLPGPMFWHLDGCNMDEDFAFSFHRTRPEWEAQQREYEEFGRAFNARWEAEQRGERLWASSYVNPDFMNRSPAAAVEGVAFHLAELVQDMKDAGAGRDAIENLNRRFGNLRDVISGADLALAGPVAERFRESLDSLAAGHPPLAEKFADLERRVSELADRLAEPPDESPW
jgi:hypothetical protein